MLVRLFYLYYQANLHQDITEHNCSCPVMCSACEILTHYYSYFLAIWQEKYALQYERHTDKHRQEFAVCHHGRFYPDIYILHRLKCIYLNCGS